MEPNDQTYEAPPSAIVKSAGRAFEVLDLFRRDRKQLNAAEIGQALGYPKSSTNALLKSLVTLGYLHLNYRTMRYFPSLNVTRLGDWIPPAITATGDILALLMEIHSVTQETVTLSVLNDLSANFLKVLPGTFPISLTMAEGFNASLFSSAVGSALLSLLPDEEIVAIATRQAMRTRVRAERIDLSELKKSIEETRSKGYSLISDAVLPDTAAIAFPCPSEMEGLPLAIGVGGLRDRILRNEKQIVRTIRSSIARHLGTRTRTPHREVL